MSWSGGDVRMYRRLFSFGHVGLRFVPLMIVLALLESVFEGASLALIIPLMQTLGGGSPAANQGRLLEVISNAMSAIPADSRLMLVIATILTAVILKSLVSYINLVMLGVVYGRLSHNLRSGMFKSIFGMPLAALERERSGRLLNALNNETWRAADALNTLFTIVTSLSTLLILLALLTFLSWRLTLVALLCLAVIPAVIHLLNERVEQLSDLGLKANEVLTKRTWTALSGLRTVHAFGREDYEVNRFVEHSNEVRAIFVRVALASMTTGPIIEILVTAVVGVLALLIDASKLSVPTLVGFLAILYRVQPRAVALGTLRTKLASLHAPVAEVTSLLSATTADPTNWGTTPFSRLDRGIRFNNVTFTYLGAGRPALTSLSLQIPHGSIVAIVGSSGAGKSTMLDLLLRFQNPQEGAIEIDGVPLTQLNLESWRARIAVVSQDPYVFDDTIRANILYGRLEASEAELIQAARDACADEFIRTLPNGYDTLVGERGTQISGGQRQRLSLARALIRAPELLILDEATNALDAQTERAFHETLLRSAHQRTVIIVAHRLSTVAMADQVAVLADGRLVEAGAPRALMRADGPFARVFRSERDDRVTATPP